MGDVYKRQVQKIPGVYQLTGGLTESISKNLLGIEDVYKRQVRLTMKAVFLPVYIKFPETNRVIA